MQELFEDYKSKWWYFIYKIPLMKDEIKWFFQKIFRKHHTSDLELWNLHVYLSKIIYKKLKAFRKMPRMGYPASFMDWDEDMEKNDGITKEDYDKHYEGGGMKHWNKTLDKMIYAFKKIADDDVYKPSAYKKIDEGLQLFAKYFQALWD